MQLIPLFTTDEVESRISEIADRLYRDYAGCPLAIVCIEDGARRFVEALTERLSHLTHEVHYVRARRTRGMSLGAVQVDAFDPSVLDDRDVLVVDDVADEGTTLRAVLELISLADARTIRTAVLVDKTAHRVEVLALDYVGFEVEGGWVVGYGMDVDGELRDLDEIAIVEEGSPRGSRARAVSSAPY